MTAPLALTGKNGRDIPRAIGETLATVQHLADLVLDWGFRKLKKMGERPFPKRMKGRVLPHLRRTTLTAAHFVGAMGEAYYEWYGKLKARK